ncbi:MAG: paraquat-inducible protein A [Chthoniobacterales bacterium]
MDSSNALQLELVKALVVTGAFLYLPANLVPVMTMTVNGDVEKLTVMGGVEEMVTSGLWPVAVIIFLASIAIPFCKLVTLSWMLFLHGTSTMQRERTLLRRILIKIGSWSMIDIFLLSVIAAVGQVGALASVHAEPGVIFFSVVMLCNIFASELYKPEWIWQTEQA